MLQISLVAVFGTDHIEKAACMIPTVIFPETFRGMSLKFGEDMDQHLVDQKLVFVG